VAASPLSRAEPLAGDAWPQVALQSASMTRSLRQSSPEPLISSDASRFGSKMYVHPRSTRLVTVSSPTLMAVTLAPIVYVAFVAFVWFARTQTE